MEPQNPLILNAGGVQVRIEYRRSQGDEGWTFHVYGNNPAVEILRFDCFMKNPHYHYYIPEGKNEVHTMDKREIPVPLEWTLAQLKSRLRAMIQHAGYEPVARAIDQAAVAEALAGAEMKIAGLKPSV